MYVSVSSVLRHQSGEGGGDMVVFYAQSSSTVRSGRRGGVEGGARVRKSPISCQSLLLS